MRKALALILLVVAANAALWASFNRPATDIPDWNRRISGAAWSPYPIDGGPERRLPSDAELRADMERMAPHIRSLRTYTTLNGIDRLPEIAAGLPLTFMLGAWVDGRLARSREEIERLVAAANRHASVSHVLVGNEALLFNRVPVEELAAYVREVRQRVRQPVSVAEPAAVWLRENPVTGEPDPAIRALARSVDFLAIHVLPYWEDPHADDLAQAIEDVRQVQQRYPDRPIIITEIGHPSDGRTRIQSVPSVINQARFLRGFFNYAARENLPYYIMEAIDQPWKPIARSSSRSSARCGRSRAGPRCCSPRS
jgi:exo-beta-1,3-glucanase (GH17 family)